MILLDVKIVEFPVSEFREHGIKWTPAGGAAMAGIWSPLRRGGGGPYQINVQTSGQGNAAPITAQQGADGAASVGVPLPSGLNILTGINLGLNAQLNLLAQERQRQHPCRAAAVGAQRRQGQLPGRRRISVHGVHHQRPDRAVQGLWRHARNPAPGRQPRHDPGADQQRSQLHRFLRLDAFRAWPAHPQDQHRIQCRQRRDHRALRPALARDQHRYRQGAAAGRPAGAGRAVPLQALPEQGNRTGGVRHALRWSTAIRPNWPSACASAGERLAATMDAPPYLSKPLQPGRDAGRTTPLPAAASRGHAAARAGRRQPAGGGAPETPCCGSGRMRRPRCCSPSAAAPRCGWGRGNRATPTAAAGATSWSATSPAGLQPMRCGR